MRGAYCPGNETKHSQSLLFFLGHFLWTRHWAELLAYFGLFHLTLATTPRSRHCYTPSLQSRKPSLESFRVTFAMNPELGSREAEIWTRLVRFLEPDSGTFFSYRKPHSCPRVKSNCRHLSNGFLSRWHVIWDIEDDLWEVTEAKHCLGGYGGAGLGSSLGRSFSYCFLMF